jgi:hypothetical protein
MRRLLLILAAAALMVVLMATIVSPAFADRRVLIANENGQGNGEGFATDYGCIQHQSDDHPDCGWHGDF